MNIQTPQSFGQLLDKIFQVMRGNFGVLLILMLLFLGPSLVLGVFLPQPNTPMPEWSSLGDPAYWEQWAMEVQQGQFDQANLSNGVLSLMTLGLSAIGYILALAAVIFLVDANRKEQTPEVAAIVKRSFKKFFPMLGSFLCLYLLLFGGTMVAFLVLGFVVAILAISTGSVAVIMIILLLVALPVFIIMCYFGIRLNFAPAATAMADVCPGISHSWKLTRKNVLRCLGVFLVVSLITGVLGGVLQMLLGYLGVAGAILYIPFGLIFSAVSFVAIAVLFFDLEVRNNAEGLRDMVDSLGD
jgi:hypothetical protein